MNLDKYREDLKSAEQKLVRLQEDREELDIRIAEIKKDVIHLSALTGADKARELLADVGLSEMCATVMKWVGSPVNASQIKKLISEFGYNIEIHSNPLASIHTTLKRMEHAGKARAIPQQDGSTAYEQIRQKPNDKTARRPRSERKSEGRKRKLAHGGTRRH